MKKITILLFVFSALFSTSCKTTQSLFQEDTTPYLDEDFQCKTGVLPIESDPRRLLIQETFRSSLFQKTSPGKPSIILTGDSTAALFTHELLEKYLPDYAISNRAIPGETTVTMLGRLDQDVLSAQPDLVILAIGGNDIILGRCLDQILSHTAQLIEQIQKDSSVPVLVASVPPVMSWKINAITPFYNDHLRSFVEKKKNVYYIDLWQVLSEKDRPILAEPYRRILPGGKVDSVHFNNEGYKRWAELLDEKLTQLDAKRKSRESQK